MYSGRENIPSGMADNGPRAWGEGRYMARTPPPERRRVWRQKVRITDADSGAAHTFYVDFGEYADGRLAEVFVTGHRMGTFARGVLDTMAKATSLALQSGTSPLDMARSMRGQCYPPCGPVEAEGSTVRECSSVADYVAREIEACYGEDGIRKPPESDMVSEKVAGTALNGTGV